MLLIICHECLLSIFLGLVYKTVLGFLDRLSYHKQATSRQDCFKQPVQRVQEEADFSLPISVILVLGGQG